MADGYAVLSFDKRGSGRSTAATWRASFDTYANDALAAVTLLQKRPDINAAKIGLYGPSQGGYVSLLAAAKSPAVKFLIIRSTSTATPADQEEYRLATLLAIRGYSETEIASAREFMRAKFAAPSSGDWGRYDELANAHRGARWFTEVGGAPAHDHPAHEFWQQNGGFDPLPLARDATIPILWLNAEFDESSPSAKTNADLRAIPAENITSVTIPRADHGMMAASSIHVTDEALPSATGFAPEFLRTIRSWLTKLR